jgi:methionine aminopeptidase
MVTRTTGVLTVGDVAKITVGVYSDTGLATPSTDCDVTFVVTTPSGVTTVIATTESTGSAQIVRTTAGTNAYNFESTEDGRYLWQFRSAGTVTLTTGGVIPVRSNWTSS